MSFTSKLTTIAAAGSGSSNYFIAEIVAGNTNQDMRNQTQVALDSGDNIYSTFQYTTSSDVWRLGVVKINTAGDIEAQNSVTSWNSQSPPDVTQGVYSTTVDSNGLRVSGKDSSGATAVATFSTSNLSLSSSFKATLSGYTSAPMGFFDNSGNVFVSGRNGNTTVLAKYNSSGSQQFARTYVMSSNSGLGWINGHNGTVDSSGNVYFVGNYPYFGYYGLYLKLNSSGVFQTARSAYTGSRNNEINAVKVDTSGNIYVAGTLAKSNDGTEMAFLAKYNSSHSFQWSVTHTTVADPQYSSWHNIAFDSSGNIYCAGVTQEDAGGGAFVGSYRSIAMFAKYNSSGTLQWKRGVGPPSANSSIGSTQASVAVDSGDDLVLTCCQQSGSMSSTTYVLRVPNDGSLTGTYNDVKYAEPNLGNYSQTPSFLTPSQSSSGSTSLSTGSISGSGSSTTFTNAVQVI